MSRVNIYTIQDGVGNVGKKFNSN